MFPSLNYYSLLFLFLALFLTFKLYFQSRKFRNLPPGPPSLPVIGNLHLLERPLHRTFKRMSQKHGNIFSLWFGSRLVVIVSSQAAFQECFTKNDVALANRQRSLLGKYVFYNNTEVGSCSYGEHWRNLRRIIALDVLSTQRVHSFSGIRRDEANSLIQKLAKDSCTEFAPVGLSSMFHDMTYNNMMMMISGKRYYGDESDMNSDVEEAREFRATVAELLQLAGVSNKADYLPFLRWFDFQNLEKRLKDISKRFDLLLNALLHENRSRKQRINTMIDHLLKLQESQPEYYTDQIIKGLALAMLIGGTGSSTQTLEWAMSNLLNHPEVLKKAQDELDTQVGQDRLLNESDLSNLPYLKKIVLETLRLYPPAPLLLPHMSSDDITIGGFNVPRDTIVIINGWGMQRDPRVWSEATSFKPQRFDEGEGKKLVAFRMGRRACPGEPLAMQSVGLTLGLLIQCFDWKRVSEEDLDMLENKHSFMLARLVPLQAMCRARPIVNKI